MDTTITVAYQPVDEAEADRIEGWLDRLAGRFDLWEPYIDVRVAAGRMPGAVSLGSYGHKYEIDRLDLLARVLSRLIPDSDVRVDQEGDEDGYWGETATYNSGRQIRSGRREWVEADVAEA